MKKVTFALLDGNATRITLRSSDDEADWLDAGGTDSGRPSRGLVAYTSPFAFLGLPHLRSQIHSKNARRRAHPLYSAPSDSEEGVIKSCNARSISFLVMMPTNWFPSRTGRQPRRFW